MDGTAIGILGCAGRMGRRLMAIVAETPGCRLAGGCEREGSPQLGADLGELAGLGRLGLAAGGDPAALFAASDVVIDFTTPAGAVTHAALAAEQGTALVVGTTGLDAAQLAALREAGKRVALVYDRNMSLGVNLLALLVEQAARALDADYDVEVLEMHHRHKVDAPSGTALLLGEAAARGRGVALEEVARRTRDGQVGARPRGEIGFATLRGGDVVGEHSVILAAEGERIELGHRASNRDVFARGAVRAARWAAGRPPGFYAMRDVLGL